MLGGSDILCRKGVGSISPAPLGRLLHEAYLARSRDVAGPFFFSAAHRSRRNPTTTAAMPIWIALYQRTGRGLGPGGVYARPLPVRRCVSCALAGALAVWATVTLGPAASRGVKPRGRHLFFRFDPAVRIPIRGATTGQGGPARSSLPPSDTGCHCRRASKRP